MKLNTTEKKRETPPTFNGRFSEDGGLNFGEYTRRHLKLFIKENPGMPFELKPLLPESEDQRGFFEGAICSLVAYFQEGMDYKNYKDREKVREWLKLEFNGEIVEIDGKSHLIAQSTKNKLNGGFLERCIGFLVDNYGLNYEVLDTQRYKNWKDTIYPTGKFEFYLDYLKEIKLI